MSKVGRKHLIFMKVEPTRRTELRLIYDTLGKLVNAEQHIYYHYTKGSAPLKPLPSHVRYIEEHEYLAALQTVDNFSIHTSQSNGE